MCYLGNILPRYESMTPKLVQRTQTGVRLETTLLKTLKGLAEYLDMTLGDLLEGVVLHAFENQTPFGPETLQAIERLKSVYGCELTAADSHKLTESSQ